MIKVGAICDNVALGGQEMGCIGLLRALDRSVVSPTSIRVPRGKPSA